ncbi:peptidoglycan-binding domain-containing protein [Schumannella soli]|uniref:Peptidoglycan binding-like domain-containing protein n=1 Tax=Schumannella soli TaxID=2590779 RepID=A0A506Y5A3_9MICO|nr:peptidoglycan-binding protein [Schumannella soli]TPW77786.1 hypothetical protein FJ657_03820 [Schumannella soli]
MSTEPGRRGRAGLVAASAVTALAITAAAAVVLAAQGVLNFEDQQPKKSRTPQSFTEVKSGTVVDTVEGDFTVEPSFSVDIEADGVVTRAGVLGGVAIPEGQSVVAVNERPIFILDGQTPSYRSLGIDSVGTDVKQVQAALRRLGYRVGDKDGAYGASTARAVFAFYKDRGFLPVDQGGATIDKAAASTTGIPASELVFVPGGPYTAVTTCGRLSQRAAGKVCTISGGQSQLLVKPAKADAALVKAGQTVNLSFTNGNRVAATIQGASEPASADAGDQSADGGDTSAASGSAAGSGGSDAGTSRFIAVLAEGTAAPGSTGKAEIVLASSAVDALTIEATAIRQDSGGSFWIETASKKRVPISLGVCAGGVCEITGDQVKVSLRVRVPSLDSAAVTS